MNTEQRFVEQVRRALDESAEQLPYRVSYRLQAAREAALARLPERELAVAPVLTPAGGGTAALSFGNGPSRFGTHWLGGLPSFSSAKMGVALASVVTAVALVIGFVAIDEWSDQRLAEQIADIDIAVLADDELPISAYADRGFGVYIQTTHEE